jgi:hypothetical protein
MDYGSPEVFFEKRKKKVAIFQVFQSLWARGKGMSIEYVHVGSGGRGV